MTGDVPRMFRPRIGPTFVAVWLLSSTLVCLAILMDGNPGVARLMIVIAVCGALAYAVAVAGRQLFTIVVTRDGIEAADVSGRRMTAAWGELAAARPLRIPRHSYVRVTVAGRRRTLWLPAYLEHPDDFVTAVRELAGDDHPLVRAFTPFI